MGRSLLQKFQGPSRNLSAGCLLTHPSLGPAYLHPLPWTALVYRVCQPWDSANPGGGVGWGGVATSICCLNAFPTSGLGFLFLNRLDMISTLRTGSLHQSTNRHRHVLWESSFLRDLEDLFPHLRRQKIGCRQSTDNSVS